ncbi:MAG: L,D-transpeptidase family protein [Proteobacteria bacterium]|nr:L,D-transpeptidase family protein [Pseudomonadota bacterium]
MNPCFDDLVVGRWGARFRGVNLPCSIGRGGIGQKRGEGDGITPVGVFHLAAIKTRADRLLFHTRDLPQKAIRIADIWSDDPDDPEYNHGAYGPDYPYSHEKQYRSDPLYDAFGILDFNWPDAVAGAGSAIFMHVWRKPRHPTEGCIAFDRKVLIWIFQNWQARSRVIIC